MSSALYKNEDHDKNDFADLETFDKSMISYEFFYDDDPDINYDDIFQMSFNSGQKQHYPQTSDAKQQQLSQKNDTIIQTYDPAPPSDKGQTIPQNKPQKTVNLNFQHGNESTMFIIPNNSSPKANEEDSSLRVYHKTQRRKINLTPQAQYLKNHYYLVFTKRKRFPKKLVKKIHRVIEGPLQIGPFTRTMTRFNDLYFEENAKNYDIILQYLVLHKEEIIKQVPELKDL